MAPRAVNYDDPLTPPVAFESERRAMVDHLRKRGAATDERVLEAMLAVPRHVFVPARKEGQAYRDSPLAIGEGQTISAPHMVAMMLDALELQPGHKVLEIGTGRGYHAACTWEMVGPDGEVHSIERVEPLADAARRHLADAGYGEVEVHVGDGTEGLPDHAPYDRIYVTAGAPDVPDPLVDQLADPGILLVPQGGRRHQQLTKVRKEHASITREDLGGCAFVPLKGRFGWS